MISFGIGMLAMFAGGMDGTDLLSLNTNLDISCKCRFHDSRSLCNEQKWSITIDLANREKMGGIMTPHFYFLPIKNSIKSMI